MQFCFLYNFKQFLSFFFLAVSMNKLRTVIEEVFYNTLGIIWHILRSMAYSCWDNLKYYSHCYQRQIHVSDYIWHSLCSTWQVLFYVHFTYQCSWFPQQNWRRVPSMSPPSYTRHYMNWNSKSISSVKVMVRIILFLNKMYISCKFLVYKLQ